MAELDISKSNKEADESSDEEGGLFCGLFVDEDYKEESFQFMDHNERLFEMRLLCSTAASTDFDLTGQVVWPVSVFLSWFVARNPELFRNKTVIELGAGCGLPGLVAARLADTVVLTDGSEVVMRLLERQKPCFSKQAFDNPGKILCKELVWGSESGLAELTATISGTSAPSPSVIIGADVVCWPQCVTPLLFTVKLIFQKLADPFGGVFYIGYVCRASNIGDKFRAEAIEMGFTLEKIYGDSFLPINSDLIEICDSTKEGLSDKAGWPKNIGSQYDLELLRISLDRNNGNALVPPVYTAPTDQTDFPF